MSTHVASTFWAKHDAASGRWHPLIAHAADVGAVMERLLADDAPFGSRLAATIGARTLSPFTRALLVHLAVLHDLGKANHGFQDRALPAGARAFQRKGHVGIVLSSFADLPAVRAAIIDAVAPLGELPDAPDLFAATIAHHGRPLTAPMSLGDTAAAATFWLPYGDRAPLEEVGRLGRHARAWSGVDHHPRPSGPFVSPAFTHLYAGLLNLADWIGSTEVAFPFHPEADDDPDAYWQTARQRADAACRAIGLIPEVGLHLLDADPLPSLFPSVFGPPETATPTPIQRELASGALPRAGDRWIIEAATGSGKTEAALALYARLRARGDVGGLMFAMPTRATARAMHDRVTGLLRALHGSTAPVVTLAVGGGAPERRTTAAITVAEPLQYDDEAGRAQVLARWSTSDMRKYLSAEVVVGTIDQILLAALAVRFAHQRLACLSRHFLVVDEVHAHDDYVLEALHTLLDAHRSAGGVALLMSATLPSRALQLLAGHHPDTVPPLRQCVERPYPSLTVLGPGTGWHTTGYDDPAPARAVQWSLTSPEPAIDAAIDAASRGARVCLLRNTVRDAQRSLDAIMERNASLAWRPNPNGPTPAYHARYALPDRVALDAAVLEAFGTGASTGDGVILTATQVVEQSLDVDFDLLITDLAPIEVLLQRLGRVHRHPARDPKRPRGFREPRGLIIAPEPIDPTHERGPRGIGTVYRNLPALELTRRTVVMRPTIALPHDYRSLIEAVYHPDSVDQLRPEPGWSRAIDRAYGTNDAHASLARQVTLRFDRTYHDNHDRFRDEARVRTRLGDDTQCLELLPSAPCWYADDEASSVELREHLVRGHARSSDGTLQPAHGTIEPDGRATYCLTNGTTISYGPMGWRTDS